MEYVYILIHDHKNGLNISAHKTICSAQKEQTKLMKSMLETWNDTDYIKLSDSELKRKWPEISGFTDFFSIKRTEVKK